MTTTTNYDKRLSLLKQFLFKTVSQLQHSQLCGSQPFELQETSRVIPARRVAILHLNVGLRNKALVKALDYSTLCQIIPWDMGTSQPAAYVDRRWVTIEAPFPTALQDIDIEVDTLGHPGPNAFLLGPTVTGETVTLHLNETKHMLLAGETGSGKSWGMRSVVYQLSKGHQTDTILIDGKYGEGLGICNGLPGQIGPLATDSQAALGALTWTLNEMKRRYNLIQERGGRRFAITDEAPHHIVVVFDEFQEFMGNAAIRAAVAKIVQQGRAARIHLFGGTQKPTNDAFGDKSVVRDQLTTRLGFAVQSFAASRAAMGESEPRLDRLLGKGDAYIKTRVTNEEIIERVQMAHVPEPLLSSQANGEPRLSRWPEYDSESLENTPTTSPGRPTEEVTDYQLAASIYGATIVPQLGRGKMESLLEYIDEPIGSHEKVAALRDRGRNIWKAFQSLRENDDLPACLK